jgi:hypothetical protein
LIGRQDLSGSHKIAADHRGQMDRHECNEAQLDAGINKAGDGQAAQPPVGQHQEWLQNRPDADRQPRLPAGVPAPAGKFQSQYQQ